MADDHTTFAHPPNHEACAVPRGLERLARFDELDADEQTTPTDVADVRDVGETGMQAFQRTIAERGGTGDEVLLEQRVDGRNTGGEAECVGKERG